MPNHVRNIVRTAKFADFEKIKELIVNDKGEVTFKKVIPMPATLHIKSSTDVTKGLKILDLMRLGAMKENAISQVFGDDYDTKRVEKCIRLGHIARYNIAKYGYETWYDWCRANWGTKWNAYESKILDDSLSFWTAWNTPIPFFTALSKALPDITIRVDYADEDTGYNCGTLKLVNGECHEDCFEGGSDEAVEFADNVWSM